VLEVTMATGYGEVVRAGGRLVKNVTGYDLSRLVTGSYGSLGIIGSVCLKLWPEPAVRRTVFVRDAAAALSELYKPVAVLETSTGSTVYLEGDEATVNLQAATLGGDTYEGFVWPGLPGMPMGVSVRVPPRHISAGIGAARELSPEWFVAQHGVGVVEAGLSEVDMELVGRIRRRVEDVGGSVVITGIGLTSQERWGNPPSTLSIQKRMKTLFDPAGICNPGVLPGGL
jgi:glycolate oxidase FAD binding subunit